MLEGLKTAVGYMDVEAFLDFLGSASANAAPAAAAVSAQGFAVALVLAFLGGLAMNLTPCVLPIIPVNIAIIGRGFRRGLVFGLGQALTCGALGLAAALGGAALGALAGNRLFNFFASLMLVFLALCLFDILRLPSMRRRPLTAVAPGAVGSVAIFLLGVGSALLAGTCVAPALAALLVTTATGVASGASHYAALPFCFGLGMGFPWPFLAAGLGRLPRPGVWMVWFKRLLGVAVLALAAVYFQRGLRAPSRRSAAAPRAPQVETVQTAPAAGRRPVLYVVGAPWCVYCRKMEATTLQDPQVRSALEKFDVQKVEINDFDELKSHPVLKQVDFPGVPAYVIAPVHD